MAERLTPEYEAEMREHVAAMSNYTLGNLFARDLLAEVDRLRAELEQVSAEIVRFGIYGTAVSATKALVKRADELVTENVELRRLAAAVSGGAAGDQQPETESLCHCGHGKHRHVDSPGTPICMDCPGDEERSWRHPYTPASKGGA